MNWNQAQTLFLTARDKHKGKPIANNTRLHARVWKEEGCYEIRLHGNVIIRIYRTGIELYDGGWKSMTTKNRLNQFGPVHVFQSGFDWFVTEWNTHRPKPFMNGMVIPYE